MATREDIRSAAFPLFAEHGIDNVTAGQIAEAAGISEAEVLQQFAKPVDIALVNDHYARLLEVFLAESPDLTPSGAWIVALDDAASAMDAVAWRNETTRQTAFASDPAIAPYMADLAREAIEMTKAAVAARTGLPAGSPEVASFAGALLGSIASMPSGDFPDAATWIAAHAGTNEALGASLDKLLR